MSFCICAPRCIFLNLFPVDLQTSFELLKNVALYEVDSHNSGNHPIGYSLIACRHHLPEYTLNIG